MMENACVAEGLLDAGTFRRLAAMHVPLKRQDALLCLDAAIAWAEPSRPCPPPPDTCFIRKLAEDVRMAWLRALPRPLRRSDRRARSGRGGGGGSRRQSRPRWAPAADATSPRRAGAIAAVAVPRRIDAQLADGEQRRPDRFAEHRSSASAPSGSPSISRSRPRSSWTSSSGSGLSSNAVSIKAPAAASPMNIQPVAHSSSRTGL